jgi:hypothetical protein
MSDVKQSENSKIISAKEEANIQLLNVSFSSESMSCGIDGCSI